MPRRTLPRLPQLLTRKLYKSGQTRGADDDEIYQNRVLRSSTVLISYPVWKGHFTQTEAEQKFENGYIVLISPSDYFDHLHNTDELARNGLALGQNALVFYETRANWIANNPATSHWQPAESRVKPLRGQYVARIPATTAANKSEKINDGFTTKSDKGAGIRVYEYANKTTIGECRCQLEALFWLCDDSCKVATDNGMTAANAAVRKTEILRTCEDRGLLDRNRLTEARMLNEGGRTICPLCLKELLSQGFFTRMGQAEGREVVDLTITELNLFHIEELKIGVFNHRPYNLGWGHHHCNIVVKDAGIRQTLLWMSEVLRRNIDERHFSPTNNEN